MSNRIDQLFKNKLSEHKVSPSAEAWTKVQSGLSKKNKIIIAWRMAAVFVLMGALVGTWYFLNPNNLNPSAQLTEIKELVTPDNNGIDKPIESTPEVVKPDLAQTSQVKNRKKRNVNTSEKKETQDSKTESLAINNNGLQNQVDEIVNLTESVSITQTSKPIVIEFTLESISKVTPAAVAQASEAENSGLRKILDAALDVKNGDSDIGIIRDAKNQLFALDFKKDKTKRN